MGGKGWQGQVEGGRDDQGRWEERVGMGGWEWRDGMGGKRCAGNKGRRERGSDGQ